MSQVDQTDQIVEGILDFLKNQDALDLLPQIARKLSKVGATAVDPNLATVVSAVGLTDDQKNKLINLLSEKFNRPIKLKTRIDPTILGGFLISVAGQSIDTTINSRLNELKVKAAYG
ncbi:MAG: ATP synthase subunit delta [Candidatus Beckwithbacteria bacterium GW2011_GWB1_47_15]|uniref:ATP synthase subunit delta n=1 Tax=Candidatus Beckwithbacteria bacterium GW2011_GWB1_47_15 TaxID=1618371 RepID=A0A0G1RUE8_9BACT|nr:MAG: F1Fo ATPase subunit delta, F-type H+-transporting ATPase subunit delta [Candidatus Beckwithbacteria bacterium GW2011_GWC1_49_16]KKU35118.1 MAG: ATP synthase subunit delta [Candidatus Beckwithbacteria bacterium GW2011_GWA1_46_30]KKU60762.1 MAG: ATP synthase subunit delta [Candidatus Beckwithbacteria bacterium GW2011_GWB1_47_15]KKU71567.1 MAG: ATP synthase subunit delta [Candidatus Beckwithbacteria bacterium GW2011_GWA2_47_25]KKW03480.1 MAG: ATP synthase subunit delta [Candidatus Beckwith